MIKSQPRLTSPLLVRKTLSNGNNSNNITRSPTRSATNTIANTYHYSFGNSNSNNKNSSFIRDNSFDKFSINGNINNNDNYGHKATYASNGSVGGDGVGGSGAGDILNTTKHQLDMILMNCYVSVVRRFSTNIAQPQQQHMIFHLSKGFASATTQTLCQWHCTVAVHIALNCKQ
ncbi:hypothetical protein EVAR_71060_1 [Eumeta japonica]|uniref:Uncharacterized protein n=1 Tax=Eumeta variegata TaxID=151549 RepID=A0A4C1SJR7_EUMVA|nr:hypothetical protein EVAR_71060_1 [Eumeta japonica]